MSSDLNENNKKLSGRSSKIVDTTVFSWLKRSYENDFHGSPSKLIEKLDKAFEREIKKAKDGTGSLLSDKTIRNFFIGDAPPTASLKTLNYLCHVLLGYKNYGEALEKKSEIPSRSELEDNESKRLDLNKNERILELENESCLEEILQPYLLKTREKLNTMKVLDMRERLPLDDIYTETYFWKNSTFVTDRIARISDASLPVKNLRINAFDKIREIQHLMIMGGPGTGKTAFLKKVGLRYLDKDISNRDFGKWYVPIYVSVKIFGAKIESTNLKSVLLERLADFIQPNDFEKMLRKGQFFLLLDALDEYSNLNAMCNRIEEFLEIYDSNRIIITNRLGIPDCKIAEFDEVEIAEFDKEQISVFAKKWFDATKKKELEFDAEAEEMYEEDWEPLEMAEKFLHELARNNAIAGACINPLILTYVCLRFKEEYGLPKNISGLLKDIVYILLKRWDATRRIKRIPNDADRLSDDRKIELFGKIAYKGFAKEPSRQFLWCEDELIEEIKIFLKNVSTINSSEIDSSTKLMLEVMIRDHGLFIPQGKMHSFPHLTYQEYFVADYIQSHLSSDLKLLCKTLDDYLFDRQWEQVFLMLTEKLNDAGDFFKHMFWHINTSIKGKDEIQGMLHWLNDFTSSLNVNTSAWRSFLLATDLETSIYLRRHSIDINYSYAQELSDQAVLFNKKRNKITPNQPKLVVALYLVIIYDLVIDLLGDLKDLKDKPRLKAASEFAMKELRIDTETTINKELDLAIAKAKLIDDMPTLMEKLNDLRESMPKISEYSGYRDWKDWNNEVLGLMNDFFNIGHKVVFTPDTQKALDDYIYANNLLMKCILGENVSDSNLREKIFDHMLLPFDLIPQEQLLPFSHTNNLIFAEIS
ncbi:NACHT domain-containing protein [Pseudanabaena mucicola]|uniref:NACHT domain-containing protein n=1 Tax=Pseudanabaena mucicola TaxID=71190 RepID=UPI002575AEE6|nr:hypothetical protein [Pseudanabaena mucicola]